MWILLTLQFGSAVTVFLSRLSSKPASLNILNCPRTHFILQMFMQMCSVQVNVLYKLSYILKLSISFYQFVIKNSQLQISSDNCLSLINFLSNCEVQNYFQKHLIMPVLHLYGISGQRS